ncbi:MAG: class I SAM-dependent DNA methyltransferase [Candidatus Hodarchaeales archaeon]|jgi:SAM-dependent methyltransferase
MTSYGSKFSQIYNQHFSRFATWIAPKLLDFYENTQIGGHNKNILDLCCGTGQLANFFLQKNYHVIGLDKSEHMLEYAKTNNLEHIESGKADFILGDANNFDIHKKFGLVVSTFNSLNHFGDLESLRNCFKCVRHVLEANGYFIFDLNTHKGLLARWNGIEITDAEDYVLINRGIYEEKKGLRRITGFIRTSDGKYERFNEIFHQIVFEIVDVKKLLLETGFNQVYFAKETNFSTSISAPEEYSFVFIIACVSDMK